VPRFEPFPAIRFDLARLDIADVIAPPYDVIDVETRARLAARNSYNVVHIDLPVDGGRSGDRYDNARCLLDEWSAAGVLVADAHPTFTVHRMTYTGDDGTPRQTTGVLGALHLGEAGRAILPHERTTPKARSDRLELLRACRANLSAIWGLSLAKGLSDLLVLGDEPLVDIADPDDPAVRHTVWTIDDRDRLDAVAEAVGDHPVVIADGHHRYETALAYWREREAAKDDPAPAGSTLAYLVELVDTELSVGAIHRVLSGLPEGFDVARALEPWFENLGPPPANEPITTAMAEAGAVCLVRSEGDLLLRPRQAALTEAREFDSSRLDVALAELLPHTLTFEHDIARLRHLIHKGDADAGVLVRPATVAQIEATAHGGDLMPPKTTFFRPKPKTGLVFRRV
jgi:uncharacterized protein (DUF1015 family)